MPMLINELLTHIFETQTHALAAQFGLWVVSSARFRAFGEQYRDKIRKKVRGTRDQEGLKDLTFELEIAFLLLSERRFAVEYEKGGVGKQREPDFCVTFKTHLPFNVEVKRLRSSAIDRTNEPPEHSRIASTVCQKIGQLPTGMLNMLAVSSDSERDHASDVAAAMAGLRTRAERKDDLFFTRRGFLGAAIFSNSTSGSAPCCSTPTSLPATSRPACSGPTRSRASACPAICATRSSDSARMGEPLMP